MALSKEDVNDLKRGIKMAKASKKPFQFIYCAGDEEGNPKLIIDKRVNSKKASLRKTATKKQFASGRVVRLSKTLMAFVIDQTNAPKFKKDVQLVFGKGLPLIKKMDVLSAEEYDIFLMDAEAKPAEAAQDSEKGARAEKASPSESDPDADSDASDVGAAIGGWMEGLADDVVELGTDLMGRFDDFFKDPDKLSSKEIKELYEESSKIDGMCQTDHFKENAKVLKNERTFRKHTAKVKDEYKVVKARIKEEKKVAKELVGQIKAEGPNPDPDVIAKIREQLQNTISELEVMMKKANDLKGKRKAG